MVDQLLGHWKLEKNEGFDEYMKAVGVNKLLRVTGNNITSYEEISREGDTWTIHITSTFKNSKLVFKLGEPFSEDTLDGRKVTNTVTIEGDKLVSDQQPTKDKELPSHFEREILADGRMVLTCTCINSEKGNVTAKRYFIRYKP